MVHITIEGDGGLNCGGVKCYNSPMGDKVVILMMFGPAVLTALIAIVLIFTGKDTTPFIYFAGGFCGGWYISMLVTSLLIAKEEKQKRQTP